MRVVAAAGQVCVCVSLLLMTTTVYSAHDKHRRADNSAIAGDVNDLLEMVPFDQLAALFFEYMSADLQVNKVLHYLTSDSFKANLVQFETSSAFHEAYDSLVPLGVDIYVWTNELNRLLDIAQIRPRSRRSSPGNGGRFFIKNIRSRRSPGDGVYGLIKDALALLPLSDIKEAYNHKLDTNPEFEGVMDKLVGSELRSHMYALMSTPEYEDTVRHLNELSVPVSEIIDLLEDHLVDFFDLDSKEDDDEPDD